MKAVSILPLDMIGALLDVLKYFWKYDINMSHIESRPSKNSENNCDFNVNFDGKPGDPIIDKLLDDLKRHCSTFLVMSDKTGWLKI